jgi:transcriptional repressor NrdR
MERVEDAINQIKRKVRETGEREIDSRRLGELVMDGLRGLDQVAYVRFASVYRSFEDVRAFLEEIEGLENDLPPDLRKQQLDLLPSEKLRKKSDK